MWIIALLFVMLPIPAFAQNIPIINFDTGVLYWDWSQGTGGVVDNFILRCGHSTGNYTVVTTIPPDRRSVTAKESLPTPGTWYCKLNGVNKYGEGPSTNELPFESGLTPNAATNFRTTP